MMLKIEKAVLCGILTALIAMSATNVTVFAQQCADIRQKVFRLHILANSDSAADQALKLRVRDKILEASGTLFSKSGGKSDAENEAKKNLSKIQQIAQDEVRREGYSYPVKARIVNMYFTTRTYGSLTLPAGYYDALRITIGKAAGHNWWCVLFPPICLPSAEGTQKMTDVLGSGEAGIIKNGSKTYVIKFKSVELFESLKKSLTGAFDNLRHAL